MELILKQDVEGLGFKDDIVTVKNGYGRNYLIPNGNAVLASSTIFCSLKARCFKFSASTFFADEVANAIKALEIKIASKVGTGDKLFGSVNNIDVSEALSKEGQDIDKKFITVIGGNVKRLGKYNAVVRLHREVTIDLPFEVIPQP